MNDKVCPFPPCLKRPEAKVCIEKVNFKYVFYILSKKSRLKADFWVKISKRKSRVSKRQFDIKFMSTLRLFCQIAEQQKNFSR